MSTSQTSGLVGDAGLDPTAALLSMPASTTGATLGVLNAREQRTLPLQSVSAGDGRLEFTTEGTDMPAVSVDEAGIVEIEIPIGTRQPIACYLRPDRPDAATLLAAAFQQVKKQARGFSLHLVDAGAVGSSPFVMGEALYAVSEEGTTLAGAIRAAVFVSHIGVVACLHDEPGYKETFRRVTSRLVDTLTTDEPPMHVPSEVTIHKVSVGGRVVGFSREELFQEEGRGVVETTLFSVLLVPSPSEMVDMTALRVSMTDPQGVVQKMVSAQSSAGEKQQEVAVERADDNRYNVKGMWNGQPVRGTFLANPPLVGDWTARQDLVSRILRAAAPETLKTSAYLPNRDPLHAQENTVRPTKDKNVLEVTSGGQKTRITIDEEGRQTRAQMQMGNTVMEMERIFFDRPLPRTAKNGTGSDALSL